MAPEILSRLNGSGYFKMGVVLLLIFGLVGISMGTTYVRNTYLSTPKLVVTTQANITQLFVKDPYVDVRAFGAKGDHSVDDSAAIQAAVNYAQANRIQEVSVPCGNYSLKTTVTVSCDYPITIRGYGYCTNFDLTGSQQYGFIIGKPSDNSYSCGMRDFRIRGQVKSYYGQANNTGWAIGIFNMHFATISNCHLQYGASGGIRILANGTNQISVGNHVDNCYIGEFHTGKGIRIETIGPGNGDTPWNNYNTVTNTWINKNKWGVFIIKGNSSTGTVSANKFLNDYIETRYNKSTIGIYTMGADQDSFINTNLDIVDDGVAIYASPLYGNGEYFDVNMERGNISGWGPNMTLFRHDRFGRYIMAKGSFAINGFVNASNFTSKPNVTFFNDPKVKVGDAIDGKRLKVYRVADEGTSSVDVYVDNSKNGVVSGSDASLNLFANSAGAVAVRTNNFYIGQGGSNYYLGIFGYITAATASKAVKMQVDDGQDSFKITRDDTYVKSMNVTFPLVIQESACRGACVKGTISYNATAVKGCICIATNTWYNFSLARP